MRLQQLDARRVESPRGPQFNKFNFAAAERSPANIERSSAQSDIICDKVRRAMLKVSLQP